MKVRNLINENGKAVANQFTITEEKDGIVTKVAFQSYDSLVCEVVPECGMGFDCLVRFGRDWDFSRTTTKNLLIFLSRYPATKELTSSNDIREAIKRGYIRGKEEIAVMYDRTMK